MRILRTPSLLSSSAVFAGAADDDGGGDNDGGDDGDGDGACANARGSFRSDDVGIGEYHSDAFSAAHCKSSRTTICHGYLIRDFNFRLDPGRHSSAPMTNSLSYEYTLKSKRDESASRGVARRE